MSTGPLTLAAAARYYTAKLGFGLVPIPLVNGKPTKGPTAPGWNAPSKVIRDPDAAARYWTEHPRHNMGALLEDSRAVSVDVDDLDATRLVFEDLGLAYEALLTGAPRIHSRPGRDKALFAAPEGVALSTHKLKWPDLDGRRDPKTGKLLEMTVFELRAGRVQDVLPPSIHPDTGQPYTWRVKPNGALPALPPELLELWVNWSAYQDALRDVCPWAPKTERPSPKRGPGDVSVIAAFNAAHDVRAILEAHGYRPKGKRWLAPSSRSGIPGVRLLGDGKVFSDHAGDPLADGHTHDAFDCYRLLDHGGDTGKAAKAAAERLGLRNRSPARAQEARSDAEPAEWPDPIPLAMLPVAIREAAAEVARFSHVPIASPATIGISTVALAIGKKALVEERRGLRHHPALFHALIAASGERKTPPFMLMTQALEAWIARQLRDYEAQRRDVLANNEMIEARIKGLRRKGEKPDADIDALKRDVAQLKARILPEPPHPRMFTSDATEQRLFQKMEQHHGAYAVLSGEGRPVFDAIMGKYSGEGRTGDAIYLAGISGDTITRDRVGNEHGPEEKAIVRPCLNVCVMVQPDKYLEAAAHPSLRASGALARIWPVWLPSLVGRRLEAADDPDLDTARLAGYEALVTRLLDQPLRTDDHGHPRVHVATLSPEARDARREFHNAIETLMGDGAELQDVRDIASKAVSQTAKLALVLHLAADPEALLDDASVIGIDAWLAAQTIGTYHLTEAVRVQRLADEDTTLDMARRVLSWLSQQKLTEVSSTTLMQYSPRPRPSAQQAGLVLDLLVEHRYLRPCQDQHRRRPVFQTHPSLAN